MVDGPGDRRRARQVAEELIRPGPDDPGLSSGYSRFVMEYGWVLRAVGEPEHALTQIDRWLFKSPGVYRKQFSVLLLERARIEWALGRPNDAEKDVETLFRLLTREEMSIYHTPACLVRGFLRERRGDGVGALDAWKQGILADDKVDFTYGIEWVNNLILTALAGELSDERAGRLMATLLAAMGTDSPVLSMQNLLRIPPFVLRDAWTTPKGREAARSFAFQTVPFGRYTRLPLLALASQVIRQGAFDRDLTAEEADIIWTMLDDGFSTYLDGWLGQAQAIPLGLIWKRGVTGLFGWASVAPALTQPIRGPLAYVLGHRCLRLGKPSEAADFFRSVLADAPPDSSLARLARAEADRLGAR